MTPERLAVCSLMSARLNARLRLFRVDVTTFVRFT